MIQPPDDLPDEQVEVFQQAAEHFAMAYREQQTGDLAAALRGYRLSIRLYPTAEAHTFLGWVYAMLNLYELAIAECRKAVALDPSFGNAYNDIGAWLVELGREDEAIAWFEQAAVAPRYAARGFPWFNLGRVYERKGAWHRAIECFAAALATQPEYPEARRALALLEARLN
ncbi:MAG: tetratricopeptide repeat protein [Caldilineaceae bacterium]